MGAMHRENGIPEIYKLIDQKGYTKSETNNYLWMYEMNWLPAEQIAKQPQEIVADTPLTRFAFTARNDSWCWKWTCCTAEPAVCLCEAVEDHGIYYAQNTADAIMRQIIEYCASANSALSSDNREEYQIFEYQLKEQLLAWQSALEYIIPKSHIDTITLLMNMPLKMQSSKYGNWYALLSQDQMNQLIKSCVGFPLIDKKFDVAHKT